MSQEETRQERKPKSELVGIWGDASIQKKKECAAIGIKMCWNSGSRVDTNSHVLVLMTLFQDYWQCNGVTTCHKQTVIQEKSNLSEKKIKKLEHPSHIFFCLFPRSRTFWHRL